MRNLKKFDIVSDKSILIWDEAFPIGCAKLGSLIYGDGPIKISVDRVDLWDNRPDPTILEEGFNFQNLVRLSTSGRDEDWNGERYRLFELTSRRYPYPTKLTGGRLELDFGVRTDNVCGRVSLKEAICSLSIEDGKVGRIEAFMSAVRFVGAMRVYGDFKLDLHIPLYFSEEAKDKPSVVTGKTTSLYYPKSEVVKDGEYIYFVQKTHTDYRFGTVALLKQLDGYSEIYYTAASTDDGEDFISLAKEELLRAYEHGYDELRREHIAWWKKYWQKSEITVGDELFEKTYYRGYYLFGSCSREGVAPMPLQAIWTADNDALPPWNGDYHHDTNTQMFYQAYLRGNRLSEGRAFIDYLWKMRDAFKSFTKRFFRVPGMLIPGTMSLDGTPLAGWAHYTLSPTMAIWVAQSFDEFWLYTGDKKFMRTRAYPFFKDIARAITALLEEKDGRLVLPLSSSPEIFDNERRAYLEPNSNFDQALLIYLYKTLVSYCRVLEKDSSEYEKILEKLGWIAVNGEGMVMLDPKQNLEECHRHFSHLMCLYPLHLINYDTEENKNIYEKTMLHLERLGNGWWVGFSYPMCAQIYAMMHNGNAAYEKLRTFCRGFIADNAFHLSGDFKKYGFCQWHYRPFTLESTFGYCDALQEMLLQDNNGYIETFGAMPDDWRQASFKNLRSYGGILVSAEYKDGRTSKITLSARKKTSVRILNGFGTDALIVRCGGEEKAIKAQTGAAFEITFSGKATINPKK